MRRQISERFNRRGAALGRAFDDWLAAEREIVWKPLVEISERNDEHSPDEKTTLIVPSIMNR